VTTEGSGGTNSCNVPLFVTVFPCTWMQCEFCELVRHPKTGDAVGCCLVRVSVHPTSALSSAGSGSRIPAGGIGNSAALSVAQGLPLPPFLVDTVLPRLLKK